MSSAKKLLEAAAGNAGGAGLDVAEVFSTFLYEGTGSNRTLTNGIDFDDEGGLVWIKARSSATDHFLFDTERGPQKRLITNATLGEYDLSSLGGLSAFNANGFNIGSYAGINYVGRDYTSWSFKKQAKFFDVVTWTGNGQSTQTIPHNLGSAPGFITIKATGLTQSWWSYHRSLGTSKYLKLETNGAAASGSIVTATSDSDFTVGSTTTSTGYEYVAYVFAHNDGDGEFGPNSDQDIISCGTYTGNGTTPNAQTEQNGPTIDLGWEPQFLIIKSTSATGEWYLFDKMRGLTAVFSGEGKNIIYPNKSNAETALSASYAYLKITSTGFKITAGAGALFNQNNQSYIYMAIRAPMIKEPEAATEVFNVTELTAGAATNITTNFPVDAQLLVGIGSTYIVSYAIDRLRGVSTNNTASGRVLQPHNTAAESSITITRDWGSTGFQVPDYVTNFRTVYYNFKRAKGFFDVVAYTGNGTSSNSVRTAAITHNLGVRPEMAWIRRRDSASEWVVAHKSYGSGYLNLVNAFATFPVGGVNFNDAFTDTNFKIGGWQQEANFNVSGATYIAYLFATLDGISKVGAYTGTSADHVIDCGFSNGAKFVLIKRTNAVSEWFLFDTERGITTTSNDGVIQLNSTLREYTEAAFGGGNMIEPASSGFKLTSNGQMNNSSGSYIFYAVAT